MRSYTAAEIVQTIPKELATLRDDFPDAGWARKLAPMMEELAEIARTAPEIDSARLADLDMRISQLISSDKKLKGLAPLQWMVASLKAFDVATHDT
jgi:hypothetical protein